MSNFNSADIAAFKDVWVFCEQREGKLMPTDFELISKGRDLANELGVNVCGLLLGGKGIESAAKELGGYGADKVYVCEDEKLAVYNTDAYAKVICDVIEDLKPEAFLIGATNIGAPLRGPPAHRPVRRLHPPGHRRCQLHPVPAGEQHPGRGRAEVGHGGPEPEDDPSGLRRPPDGHHHLPPLPSLHGHGAPGRYEEEPLRPGQGGRLRH